MRRWWSCSFTTSLLQYHYALKNDPYRQAAEWFGLGFFLKISKKKVLCRIQKHVTLPCFFLNECKSCSQTKLHLLLCQFFLNCHCSLKMWTKNAYCSKVIILLLTGVKPSWLHSPVIFQLKYLLFVISFDTTAILQHYCRRPFSSIS